MTNPRALHAMLLIQQGMQELYSEVPSALGARWFYNSLYVQLWAVDTYVTNVCCLFNLMISRMISIISLYYSLNLFSITWYYSHSLMYHAYVPEYWHKYGWFFHVVLLNWWEPHLHSRYCQPLNSYKAHVFPGTSNLCLKRGVSPHIAAHLFDCPKLSRTSNSSNCSRPIGSASQSSWFYLFHKNYLSAWHEMIWHANTMTITWVAVVLYYWISRSTLPVILNCLSQWLMHAL